MYLGLLDLHGHALHPSAVTRVDCDSIKWVLRYARDHRIKVSNLTSIDFRALKKIEPRYVGLFIHADDSEPFAGPFELGLSGMTIYPDSTIRIEREKMLVDTIFTNEVKLV